MQPVHLFAAQALLAQVRQFLCIALPPSLRVKERNGLDEVPVHKPTAQAVRPNPTSAIRAERASSSRKSCSPPAVNL